MRRARRHKKTRRRECRFDKTLKKLFSPVHEG